MKRRRLWIGIAIVVLIPILVPLVTLPRAKAEVLRSLEASLGRQISARAVHFQILPLPGVDLDHVQLADDPAFGLEALVIADSATANISVWNLLRGHLVFSHIHLQSPSINLVRNPAGRWNIAALLDRGGAPRAQGSHSAAQRFPYVDWSDARVNFKFNQTKTHFYLDQVKGSLARENTDWRLQLSFVPARSDLNLSNTGVVTMDGRWHAPVGSLQRAPFDLVVHLRNSYLAGSTALLAGHDAGIHGILSAALQLAGTGREFSITGTLTVRSLRRWDLLPTSAAITAAVAATYTPAQDRLEIEHIGDPGWKHVQLSGTVGQVFSSRRADLSLDLHELPAAALLPVILALKANLPADLSLSGTVNGQAHVVWAADRALPRGHAAFTFTGLRLSDSSLRLGVSHAALVWNGHQLRLPAVEAVLDRPGAEAAHARFQGVLDPRGFALTVAIPSLSAEGTAALTGLLGLPSPWPARVSGAARLELQLAAPWSQFRNAHWSGEAEFARAQYRPLGSAGFALQPLAVSLGASGPLRARFTLASVPVHGSLAWDPAGRLQFALAGREVQDRAFWALLPFSHADLLQRMVSAVMGGDARMAPAWLSRLHAIGSVQLQQLDWHGIPADVQLRLTATPDAWRANVFDVRVAEGRFEGHGRLLPGQVHVSGSVPASRPLHLSALLRSTRYAGKLRGRLSGSLRLTRPILGGDMRRLDAAGAFEIRNGSLTTSGGPWRFQFCRGRYQLQQGRMKLADLDCLAQGLRYSGSGIARLLSSGTVSYALTLRHGVRTLRLTAQP